MPANTPTICALATGGGMAAIAVIRLSGPEAFRIADAVFKGRNNLKLADQAGYTLHFGRVVHNGTTIDEVLASVFHGPNSYTGEDTVEISCHGSTYIQQEILQALYAQGATPAKPGEFTLRAFLNGKIDLSQAEAVADLIASENRAAHSLALKQLRGGYSDEIRQLREELLHFAALIELELDFSTEDVEFADRSQLETLVNKVLSVINRLRESFAMGNVLKNGIPVTIAGRPNAGKSTLLNALLNEERAIVTPIAGTTRDAIEDEITLDGIAYRFIDTAGLRHTTDEVESIGIERSYERIKEAEIVLYLFDATTADQQQVLQDLADLRKRTGTEKLIIPVGNKTDQLTASVSQLFEQTRDVVWLSALRKEGLNELLARLKSRIEQSGLHSGEHIVTNARHFEALSKAATSLQQVLDGLSQAIPGDLLAIDIRAALAVLSEITGEVTSDEVLGAIFGKFCIGK